MSNPTYDPYDPNVPENFSDTLNISQPELLNNFAKLYQAFAQNHVPLDAVAGAGNHTILQLSEIPVTTLPQTNAGEISIYSKDVSGQTDQVFLRYQGNGQEIQLTNYQIYTLDNSPTPLRFFSFLPGKTIIYFGAVQSVGTSTFTLNLEPLPITALLAASFCPLTIPNFLPLKPWVTLDTNSKNQVTGVILNRGATTVLASFYYIIIANM